MELISVSEELHTKKQLRNMKRFFYELITELGKRIESEGVPNNKIEVMLIIELLKIKSRFRALIMKIHQ